MTLTNASEFYFSQIHSSISRNATIWSYDTDSKKTTHIADISEKFYTAYSMISGSTVCGSNCFASAVDVMVAWVLL